MLRKSLKIAFFNLTLAGALWAQAQVLDITSPTSGQSIDTSDVTVSFTMASYFTVGDSACTDCDGFVRAFLNDVQVASVSSTADFTISGVTDGSYMLSMEAVDPTGTSFDPAIEDTVSFNVVGNPELCAPYDVLVYPGDGRNTIEWSEPVLGSGGGLGCGDYIITSLPFSETNTNVGMVDDWDLTASDGEDVAYTLNLSSETTIDITLCDASTTYDTKVEIFTFDGTDCSLTYTDAVTTGNYNDDFTCTFSVLQSTLQNVTLAAGQYYIVVDGFAGQTGNYGISVVESTGRSVAPNTAADFDLELLKSGLNPDDLFADFQNLENARNSSTREIEILCGTFVQYNIYNLTDGSLAGTSDTTYFLHDNLTNNTEFCYYVRAEYTEGESANSDTACATPAAFVAEPVTNLMATPLDEEVALSWTVPSTSDYVEFTSFEGSDGGFTGSGGFERGIPTVGPSSAGSGDECWGTNLNANYDNSMYATITSPAYDLTGLTSPMMQINHWYNIELNWDGGNVKISDDNGSTWAILTPTVAYPVAAVNAANVGIPGEPAYSGTNTSNHWHTVQFDLSSYDTSTVMFRFDFGSDPSIPYEGWYIDDFALFEYSGGRENDGDLTHYNVYLDGVLVEDSVEVTGYLVTGLTNATTYTFGVTAAYYPNYESDAVTVSATPTWLYGDIVGTVTDPNGTLLDSAVVYSGDVVDTTGTDGQYALMNLNPGSNLITVERNGFETLEEFVTVVAQEDAGTANFELIPKIDAPGELIATPGDETVHLIWNKPGTSLAGDLTGVWTLFFDWSCTGAPGTVEVEFMENGEFYAYGTLQGFWVGEEETVDLSGGAGCDAVNYEYNAYFNFLTTPTIYYMFVDDDEFNGVITSGYGAHDGDNWGQRVDGGQARMPMGNRAVADEMLITNMRDVIFSDRMLNDATMKAQLAEQINLSKSDLYNNLANVRSLSRTSSDSLIGYNVYQVLDSGDTLVATTNSADDTTASIAVPANYVEYCYNVRARWDTDDYGVLESYPTDVACAVPYRAGDTNFDDVVDISDLLAVINFILEIDLPTENEYRNADVNNDGELNIADVVMIVDVILGRSSSRTLAAVDGDIFVDLLSADQQLLVNLDYAGLTRGIQFELSADQTLEFGTPLLAVNDAGTMVASNRAEDGTVTVVVVNTSGGTVERAEDVLVRIPYTFKGDRSDRTVVELTDLKAAGMAGESLPVTIREKRIDISVVPSVFALHQNYPNPFNPVTEIQFDVPKESQVTLTIYNIMGQEVTTLTNSTLKAGFHSVRWDGTNGLGEQVSTGLYFYRLSSPAFTSIKKMIMVK